MKLEDIKLHRPDMKGPVMSAFQGFRRTKYIHTYSLFKVSSHWGCNEIHLLITSIQSCLWHQLPRVLVGSLGSSAVPTHHRQGSWTRRDQNCRVTSNKHILTSPKKHLLLPGKSIFNAYCGAVLQCICTSTCIFMNLYVLTAHRMMQPTA